MTEHAPLIIDVAGTGISLGLTLYSLTNEWWSKQYDLEGLVAAAVERGLGPGVEIVACKHNLCQAKVGVLVSPVFFGWCFQFGKDMKILSPGSVAAEMKEHAQKVTRMYRG